MKTVTAARITEAVRGLAIAAAHDLEPDILDALVAARDRETSPLAKNVLELLMHNADIASRDEIPLCQDTGICTIFITMGQEVHVAGDLAAAIQEGVRRGYEEGFLRKSVCDVMTRNNTGTNLPAVIHVELEPGERCRLRFLPKGCGSENMSGLKMLPPAAGIPGAVDYIVETVVSAGPNPCPPLVVGVGIGGNFEKAALMAKKVLLRPLGRPSEREDVARLEEQLLTRLNREGRGVLGLGGCNTVLAVHVDTFPTHIASLPVAVNIQCHSHRHKEVDL
ncbi:Fumarate hydratase class I, alpha region; L(+)-tartrate dehydratase alpha subunit [hydrothermal vent metagenome]|uniref:Fumarate hydratase class I, alpha region L(+)-tartrate dehydratase alpha subunit n=1 Tax=hydrothermal vent metagenome TaxID=652676 RepID=A0A3B0VD03_9ZZZZ